MDDLNEKELLDWIDNRIYYTKKIKYENWEEDIDLLTNLRKVVEGHFKYKYLDNDPECYHVADQGQGVDEEFIRQKVDELMCDVDSGDEVANHKFLHDFAKQLLTRQPVQVDEDELRELRVTLDAMESMSLDHVKTKVVHEHKQKWLERIPKDCAKIKQLLRGDKK